LGVARLAAQRPRGDPLPDGALSEQFFVRERRIRAPAHPFGIAILDRILGLFRQPFEDASPERESDGGQAAEAEQAEAVQEGFGAADLEIADVGAAWFIPRPEGQALRLRRESTSGAVS
jgi:hypothetical protein